MALDIPQLLKPPVARAAYSDRTAWLMAELSKLAYERFEDAGPGTLEKGLQEGGFALTQTFNKSGTQAYLALREDDHMAVLAFRGTEKNFQDIETDLDARFYRSGKDRIHDGFGRAYKDVAQDVKAAMGKLDDYKIYITGHSLGGALAVIAAHNLAADNVAACYTFGSPRVGNREFGFEIKVPIYRVVNSADIVPWVPPGTFMDIVAALFEVVPVYPFRQWLLSGVRKFQGYRHYGDMRYLTPCENYKDVQLIPNPPTLDRARWRIQRWFQDKLSMFTDHQIARYCGKLEAYAMKRTEQKIYPVLPQRT